MAFEIIGAARLVVDTGIHAFSWSRDRAIEFMSTYTTENSGEATVSPEAYSRVNIKNQYIPSNNKQEIAYSLYTLKP